MDGESWESVLPGMFRSAGIDPRAGMVVRPLTGGVSSDIVHIRFADGRDFAAKRALAKLKVAMDWEAPVERNHYEVAWLKRAAKIVPGGAPAVVAESDEHGIVVLDYLPPDDFVLWKAEMLKGRADPAIPPRVASLLGRIHAATLNDPAVAAEFPTDHLIDALRLDPYLRTTAKRHPDLAERILAVVATTASTKLALVHGDVSPKNILVSKIDGHPVLLDAETAWYGDPAFDAAFLLNHLLLKSLHMPAIGAELKRQANELFTIWVGHFPEDLRTGLEQRTAALLPCLFLARVDGKSPVEYLAEDNRQRVRDIARPLIVNPVNTIPAVIEAVR